MQLTHSHTDASGVPDLDGPHITGIMSDLLLGALSCDGACRASTGDLANPGFIGTYVCLADAGSKAWACAGYRTDPGGAEQYFVWYDVPGAKYSVVWLAPTPPSPVAGKYARAHVSILSATDTSVPGDAGAWLVFVDSYPAGGSSYFSYSYDLPFNLSNFQPTSIQYTQYIQGLSGAGSDPAIFTNNMYGATLMHDGATPTSLSPDWQTLTHDGAVTKPGPTGSPSSIGWVSAPSSTSYGGKLIAYCC